MTSEQENAEATESATHTPENVAFQSKLAAYFADSVGSDFQKLESFPKYVLRQWLSGFLAREEIFRRVLDVQGTVIEFT